MDIISLILPLFVVVFVIFLAYLTSKWIAKRQNIFSSGSVIKVIERAALGKDAYLLVVRVGEKTYLVSLSNGGVELLSELTGEIPENMPQRQERTDFAGILSSALGSDGLIGKFRKNKRDKKSNDK